MTSILSSRLLRVAFVLAMSATTCLSHAASTGSVLITASVPAACNITVTAAAGASIANLTLGATNLQVATVNESCNAPNGYTVDMVGLHSGDYTGKFVDSVSGASRTFSVRYNGSSVASTRVTDVNAPNSSVDKTVLITYPTDNTLTATSGATYNETLSFTITAK